MAEEEHPEVLPEVKEEAAPGEVSPWVARLGRHRLSRDRFSSWNSTLCTGSHDYLDCPFVLVFVQIHPFDPTKKKKKKKVRVAEEEDLEAVDKVTEKVDSLALTSTAGDGIDSSFAGMKKKKKKKPVSNPNRFQGRPICPFHLTTHPHL